MNDLVPPTPDLSSIVWPDGHPEPSGTAGRPGWFALAVVVFNGPFVWAIHFIVGLALVPAACDHGAAWTIDLLTAVCAIEIAAVTVYARRLLVLHRPGGRRPDRVVALIAVLGFLWGAISLVVTLTEGVPNLVLDPCPI